MIEHSVQWTRQPRVPTPLRNEFRKDCLALFAGILFGPNIDAVRQTTWTWPAYGPDGSVGNDTLYSNLSGSPTTILSDSSLGIPTGTSFTCVLVAPLNTASNYPNLTIGAPGSAAHEFNTYLPYAGDGKAYFRWGGSTEGTTSVSATTAGDGPNWVLSTGADGMQIWHGGVLVASNTASPSRSTSATALQIGTSGGARVWSCGLFYTAGRQFPRETNRMLSVNPWQMFQPQRRQIFIKPGAAATFNPSWARGSTSIVGSGLPGG